MMSHLNSLKFCFVSICLKVCIEMLIITATYSMEMHNLRKDPGSFRYDPLQFRSVYASDHYVTSSRFAN